MRPSGGDLNVLCAMRLYNLGDQSAKEQKSLSYIGHPINPRRRSHHTNIVPQSTKVVRGGEGRFQTPVTSVLFYVAPRADENHSTIIINLMEIIFFSKSRRSQASPYLVGSWFFWARPRLAADVWEIGKIEWSYKRYKLIPGRFR